MNILDPYDHLFYLLRTFFSLFFDAVRARIHWLNNPNALITPLFITALGIKVVILVFEAQGKDLWLFNTP